jgi:hypothetical protein
MRPPNDRMKRTAPASWSAAAYPGVLHTAPMLGNDNVGPRVGQTRQACRRRSRRGPIMPCERGMSPAVGHPCSRRRAAWPPSA